MTGALRSEGPPQGRYLQVPYVHVRVGPYDLLMDARTVHEVLDDADAGAAWREWRGHLLPVIGLRALFGVAGGTPAGAGVVFGDPAAGHLALLLADEMVGLRRLDPAERVGLPAYTPELGEVVGSLFLDPATRRGLLCFEPEPAALATIWQRRGTAAGALPP